MLQYAVIANLIHFVIHLVQISDFATGKSSSLHNRTFSMLYGLCDTWGGAAALNQPCGEMAKELDCDIPVSEF